MENIEKEVITFLEDTILKLNQIQQELLENYNNEMGNISSKIEVINTFIKEFNESNENASKNLKPKIIKQNEALYADYPAEGSVLDKIKYLESKDSRVWKQSEMKKLIKRLEGPYKGKKIVSGWLMAINKMVNNRTLIQLKFNYNNKYTFYTTREDWFTYSGSSENKKAELLPEHFPANEGLGRLTEIEKAEIGIEGLIINQNKL